MSATCFVFIQNHALTPCYAVKVVDGVTVSALSDPKWEAIKDFQTDTRTIIVLSALDASLHEITLPKLNERKKRAAVPYLLEDTLADSVTDLHFAYDDATWPNWVAVIQKTYLTDVIEVLSEHFILFDAITLDWFALVEYESEIAVISDIALINSAEFKGGLQRKIAPMEISESNIKNYEWLAERLSLVSFVNLCQNEFQHNTKRRTIKQAYQWSGYLLLACLLSLILAPLLEIWQLNNQNKLMDEKVLVAYQQFFPQAKFATSPEFRIRQWLKGKEGAGVSDFWLVLQRLSQVYNPKIMTIHQIHYAQKKLQVNLSSPTFEDLERVQRGLEKLSLKVNRTKALSENKAVQATLEIQL